MSKFIKIISGAVAILTPFSFGGSAMAKQADIISVVYSSTEQLPNATKWINEVCRPNHPADIQVVFSQNGYGTDYNFYIFCRQGTGKLRGLSFANYTYARNNFKPSEVAKLMKDASIIIIGLYAGQTIPNAKNSLYYFRIPNVSAQPD